MNRPIIALALLIGFLTFNLTVSDSTVSQATDHSSFNVGHNSPDSRYLNWNLNQETADQTNWAMAGANPERTSWSPEEISGNLKPVWFKPFEPYISQRVQIIAADGLLYVATARGLYALDATTGAERWVYPTEMPLGHSPTIANGVAYVGGFDRKLHAINASTGAGLWTFTANAGFQTNPLVVNGIVYAGNRDGTFYAIHAEGAQAGQLAWKFETGGPVLYSAAYKDGVVFFASNDSHAYALNAQTGQLVWKSAKLPGSGFTSWWPVIYKDRVILSGSNNYRFSSGLGPGGLMAIERDDIYNNEPEGTLIGALGHAPGDWVNGTVTIDASRIINYLTQKPWRRTVFVLDRFNGVEREIAPVLWTGNDGSINRYPPVIGSDGVLYQQNNYISHPSIPGGQIAGWQPGNPHISVVSSDWGAVDEPHSATAGGDLIYWNLCCDRQAGSFDITLPNTKFAETHAQGNRLPTGPTDGQREWSYFAYNLPELIPGYNASYYDPLDKVGAGHTAFGGLNGVYGVHSDVNPPTPYNGRIYMHRGNSVIAFGATSTPPQKLPVSSTKAAPTPTPSPGVNYLQAQLAEEVQRMLNAGHLRPGYVSHGHFDLRGQTICGDNLVDYWHSSSETIYTLILTLPYLPATMQQSVRAYIQSEYTNYPPFQYDHIGYRDGASREIFDLPPETAATLGNFPPAATNPGFVWKRNPFAFYALWKYAELFGGAGNIYSASKDRLDPTPADAVLLNNPHVHNAFIAGYMGYLELEKLAGQPASANVAAALEKMITLRVTQFKKDTAFTNQSDTLYCRMLNVSNNFMYLVPELAQHLRQSSLGAVQSAVAEYERVAPYWFVSLASEGLAESSRAVLYDTQGLYLAKAYILDQKGNQLDKYLDVPAFYRGDLFYIQKLVVALQAQPSFSLSAPPVIHLEPGASTTTAVSIQALGGFNSPVTLSVTSSSPALSAQITPGSVTPPATATLTLNDNHANLTHGTWVTVQVTGQGQDQTQGATISVLVGGAQSFLPLANCQVCWSRAMECLLLGCRN